jgi:acetolactate synthase I/II/III large subunit
MEKYNSAEALIEVLNAHGVDKVFINPGVETALVQATIAQYRTAGKKAPQLVLCLDESVAVSAAHGHYMISGQPQVVIVHAELGTLQLGGNLHNAQWGRIPVVLMAGYWPDEQRTTCLQHPYEQGSIVRNSVKWDYRITAEEDIHEVLPKAFLTACTEPAGPVYLYYPLDYLSKTINRLAVPPSRSAVPPLPPVDMSDLAKAADALIEAKNPLIVAGYSGRYPQNVEALKQLAETIRAPVLTSQVFMNFPTDHPLCAGIEQIGGSRRGNPYLESADVILVIDYTMPYVGVEGLPKSGARLIHVDVDPLTQGRLLWGRGADLFIKADSREAIPALDRLIRQKMTPDTHRILQERFRTLESNHQKTRSERQALAIGQSRQKPISPDWLCYCLNQAIDENTIFINHTISHSASATEQIVRTQPGTLLGCAGGSISWALGAALGAKLAAPEKTVVSLMTDGGFIWGCPTSTLWSARAYSAPFLAVICNNQGYGVVRWLQKKTLNVDSLSDKMLFEAGVEFTPDYAVIARGCGAYSRTVEDPADVLPAITEALERVRAGQTAVLDVKLGRD